MKIDAEFEFRRLHKVFYTLNFIAVDQDYAAVQLGSGFTIAPNSVGGITVDGKPSKYEIKEGKKATSSVTLNMIVSGAILEPQIYSLQ